MMWFIPMFSNARCTSNSPMLCREPLIRRLSSLISGCARELPPLSGNRSPYPGRLGVVEEGALADLLLVDGDPLADLDLIADPDNMLVIMKDGRIYKDTTRE